MCATARSTHRYTRPPEEKLPLPGGRDNGWGMGLLKESSISLSCGCHTRLSHTTFTLLKSVLAEASSALDPSALGDKHDLLLHQDIKEKLLNSPN